MAGCYRKGSVPRSKDAMVRCQNGNIVQKKFGPLERRSKKAERSEKRETSTVTARPGMVTQGW